MSVLCLNNIMKDVFPFKTTSPYKLIFIYKANKYRVAIAVIIKMHFSMAYDDFLWLKKINQKCVVLTMVLSKR